MWTELTSVTCEACLSPYTLSRAARGLKRMNGTEDALIKLDHARRCTSMLCSQNLDFPKPAVLTIRFQDEVTVTVFECK